jgi:hypothetical protein
MKNGTHNLGSNAFANTTMAKVESGALILRQNLPSGLQTVTLSVNQIELLKELLA